VLRNIPMSWTGSDRSVASPWMFENARKRSA
jgi:hypothetical protein